MSNAMTEGNPWKLILKFTLPLFLGNLFQQAYNVADAAIVGQTLGADALAAVGATGSVQFLILGFCIGAANGFAIPVASLFGAGKEDGMRRNVYTGGVLTAIISIALMISTALLAHAILHALQIPAEIYDNTYWYIFIIFLGIPCTFFYNFFSAILRAIGDSKTPFLFLAFSSVLNIFLDLFCILVLHWGVAGAAIATIFSQGLSAVLCYVLIRSKFAILRLRKENRVIEKETVLKLLNMGVPMGLQFSITAIGCMVMQSGNNALGTVYVSGFAAGTKINNFMQCPYDALATAVCTFCSQNYGGGKGERIEQGLKIGLVLAVCWGILGGLILIFFGRNMCMIFMSADNAEALNAGALYLRCVGYFWILLGFLNVTRLTTQGLGWSRRAVFSGVFELGARVLVTLVFVPKYGYTAICFADQMAWAAAVIYIVPTCMKAMRHAQADIAAGRLTEA